MVLDPLFAFFSLVDRRNEGAAFGIGFPSSFATSQV